MRTGGEEGQGDKEGRKEGMEDDVDATLSVVPITSDRGREWRDKELYSCTHVVCAV